MPGALPWRHVAEQLAKLLDRLGAGSPYAPQRPALVPDRRLRRTAVAAAATATGNPFSRVAPSIANPGSWPNRSIGYPPAGMMTSTPDSSRGRLWVTNSSRIRA